MPRDYEFSKGAVSGHATGKGKGKIGGMSEGVHPAAPLISSDSFPSPNPGTGVIRGNPVGVVGAIRRVGGKGAMAAIKRRLGR